MLNFQDLLINPFIRFTDLTLKVLSTDEVSIIIQLLTQRIYESAANKTNIYL